MYSGHGIAFDSEGSWSFDNNIARNFRISGANNSLSSHADKRKNNFLVLGKGTTSGIHGRFGIPEKKFSVNFSKANTKFCLTLPYNADYSYLFANGKELFMLNTNKKAC